MTTLGLVQNVLVTPALCFRHMVAVRRECWTGRDHCGTLSALGGRDGRLNLIVSKLSSVFPIHP